MGGCAPGSSIQQRIFAFAFNDSTLGPFADVSMILPLEPISKSRATIFSNEGVMEGQDDDEGGKQSAKCHCAACGTITESRRCCSNCRLVRYCSESCQLAHWKLKHKHECVAVGNDTDPIGK